MKSKIVFCAGLATGLLLWIVVPLVVFATGAVNMSATTKPGVIERTLAPWIADRSRAMRAPSISNPFGNAPDAIAVGLDHYREDCVVCHGAPGVKPAELARGLNPPAPRLQSPDSQSMSDGELFWTIKHGIRMTGMPAFGPTHSDDEVWKIVAFVRHLPGLSDSETKRLQMPRGDPTHAND